MTTDMPQNWNNQLEWRQGQRDGEFPERVPDQFSYWNGYFKTFYWVKSCTAISRQVNGYRISKVRVREDETVAEAIYRCCHNLAWPSSEKSTGRSCFEKWETIFNDLNIEWQPFSKEDTSKMHIEWRYALDFRDKSMTLLPYQLRYADGLEAFYFMDVHMAVGAKVNDFRSYKVKDKDDDSVAEAIYRCFDDAQSSRESRHTFQKWQAKFGNMKIKWQPLQRRKD